MYKKPKVNLILDTNIWLYLSNGNEQLTKEVSKNNLHFQLLKELKAKQNSQEITVLITDIIIKEWIRNKHHTQALIQRRTNRIENILYEFKIFSKTNDEDEIEKQKHVCEVEIASLKKDIEDNKKHVNEVERFLKTECLTIPVPDTVKLTVWEMAIDKRIPFHNNKNNIADASILLSTIEYIKSNKNENQTTIFVSNNSKDFCIDKGSNEFHPALAKLIGRLDLRFERKLDSGLEISQEIQVELEEFVKERYYDRISFDCKSSYCVNIKHFTPFGYLTESIWVVSQFEINPNQLSLFPEDKVEKKTITVSMGNCSFCGSTHIECPACDELIGDIEIGKEFSCSECNSKLLLIYAEHDNEIEIIVKDESPENEIFLTFI